MLPRRMPDRGIAALGGGASGRLQPATPRPDLQGRARARARPWRSGRGVAGCRRPDAPPPSAAIPRSGIRRGSMALVGTSLADEHEDEKSLMVQINAGQSTKLVKDLTGN